MSHGTTVRRTGRPPLTSQSALLAAARGIGFAPLTVGAVTAAAGVKYSTFYRHYPNVDALVSALVDDVCQRELPLTGAEGPWQEVIRDTSAAVGDMLGQHPGMATALVALPEMPAEVLGIYRRLTDVLLHAGFDGERAAFGAICTLDSITMTELTTPGTGRTLAGRQREIEASEPAVDPQVVAATAGLLNESTTAWTSRKISLLIQGLESELEKAL